MAARAVGVETAGAYTIQDRFGDDATRRVTGAQEQYVEFPVVSHFEPPPV
jgi:hypothetical protein